MTNGRTGTNYQVLRTKHSDAPSELDKYKLLVESIQDTGVVIASTDTATLFEKFKRIPNDLSEEVGGTGLGLYWSQKVFELHGGRIDVKSELGTGTTFKVFLPKVDQNA